MPQSSVDQILMENLKAALNDSRRSAYSVAVSLGHPPNWLYQVLNGKQGLLLPSIREIASELGVSVGSLVDPPSTYRDIPVLEIAAAAGGGATVLDETPVGRISFQQDWLSRNNINALQSVIIKVQGESMEPTLPAGCSVLVDRSRRERQDGCVYVLRTEDGLVVKRLSQQGGHWRLLSDNPVWVPVAWTPETEIIGEVRWTARVL